MRPNIIIIALLFAVSCTGRKDINKKPSLGPIPLGLFVPSPRVTPDREFPTHESTDDEEVMDTSEPLDSGSASSRPRPSSSQSPRPSGSGLRRPSSSDRNIPSTGRSNFEELVEMASDAVLDRARASTSGLSRPSSSSSGSSRRGIKRPRTSSESSQDDEETSQGEKKKCSKKCPRGKTCRCKKKRRNN